MTTVDSTLELEPMKRLTKDLANAAKTLTTREARYLVDAYYMIQENRISAAHQARTLNANGEPHDIITWLGTQNDSLETQIKRALDKWTDAHPVGRWAKSICGIGPVIAAGLLAHIDVTRASNAGHVWSFAGLNPKIEWKKGERRPFNASLKALCAFKLGESFVKTQNNENDIYGKMYAAKKKREAELNEAGAFKEIAEASLPHFKKTTEAYKWYSKGMLPLARIHARARRYAVKMFLSHYHAAAYFHQFGVMPAFPYIYEFGDEAQRTHSDYFGPPHTDLLPGFAEAEAEYAQGIRRKISGAPESAKRALKPTE